MLLPQRAVYWPGAQTLLVADLHLGKSQTFWAAGAPVPAGVLEADLARLDELLLRTECARVIVLGDLLHSGAGLTAGLVDSVASWRAKWSRVEIIVVPGNHDCALDQVASAWGLAVAEHVLREGRFVFRHDPVVTRGAYTLCGHVHPLLRVTGAGDSLRLACFWMGRAVGVLPAFSTFTRGVTIAPALQDGVFAVADGKVVAI